MQASAFLYADSVVVERREEIRNGHLASSTTLIATACLLRRY